MNCLICGNEASFFWTDLHGEGCCTHCGAPYQLLFYNDEGRPLEKPPKIHIKPDYIELCKKYWEETGTNRWGGTFISYRYPNQRAEHKQFLDWLSKQPMPGGNHEKPTD